MLKHQPRMLGTRNRMRKAISRCDSSCYYHTMTKNLTVRLPDELAADTEAVARVDGTSVNETIKNALTNAVAQRTKDPKFKARLRAIIKEDHELLERLAK